MSFSRALKKTDHLVRRWFEEPIGVAVPFFAFLAVWLPPQMPDMFAGMEAPIWKLQFSARPLLFALASFLLGLSAWYWTRAALTAHRDHGETDKARIQRRHVANGHNGAPHHSNARHHAHERTEDYVNWSYEWAPRIAMLAAGGITLLPILFSIASGRIMLGLLLAELLSFAVTGMLYWFVIHRTQFRWMNAFSAPSWMLRFRTTRVLACAPFGWPFALLSLACSFVALLCLLVQPEWVAAIDAPTTAIASLAFAVGPLVMALALFRGLVEIAIHFVRWISNKAEPRQLLPGERHRIKRLANIFGMIAMFAWFLSPPWVLEKHRVPLQQTKVVEPASSGECFEGTDAVPQGQSMCRPSLKTAVRAWVNERRNADPNAQRLPLIIVAAEGGASRAAVWLLASMRMLDHQTDNSFGQHIFALSGVSGGSLGAATYARMVAASPEGSLALNWENPETRHALRTIATRDLLSATISTYFLADMFGSLVGPAWTYAGIPDRNAALETTFDTLWNSSSGFGASSMLPSGFLGLRESRSGKSAIPHLLLNGTDVTTGKRLITSSIRINADSQLFPDTGDFIKLVSRDISLATAVTNSARFPFVSPAGRFISVSEVKDYQIIDGGYFENYGARTAWELARAIEDLNVEDPSLNVVPIIVVVSNDLEADQPPRSLHGQCRTQLGDLNEDGSQVTIRCDEPPTNQTCLEFIHAGLASNTRQQDQSIVPQSIAPILGLAATRSAHGRDALHIIKRDFCRAQTSSSGDPRVRMVHVALPKPNREKGESAPMNWVLNPEACDYMFNKAPWIEFNLAQAQKLDNTLRTVLGPARDRQSRQRPKPIDCYN